MILSYYTRTVLIINDNISNKDTLYILAIIIILNISLGNYSKIQSCTVKISFVDSIYYLENLFICFTLIMWKSHLLVTRVWKSFFLFQSAILKIHLFVLFKSILVKIPLSVSIWSFENLFFCFNLSLWKSRSVFTPI